jgi:hypothetical protein
MQVHIAPIELREGRGVMSKATLEARRKADNPHNDTYFPPVSKPVSTEAEKRKLAAIFQFKGGKALPDELTMAPVEGAFVSLALVLVCSFTTAAAAATTVAPRATRPP